MAEAKASALAEEEAAVQLLPTAHVRALAALKDSGASVLVLRLPAANREPIHDLDLLVAAGAMETVGSALLGVGFVPKTSPSGLPSKVVWATYNEGRFHGMDVHTSIVSGGLTYLDAGLVLSRRIERAGCALPSIEDSLLHLVLHALLGRRELGGKYAPRIRQMAALDLDRAYMENHLAHFGLSNVFWEALKGILGEARTQPEALWRQARKRLLVRVPWNIVGRGRYRLAGALRIRRRAALVAFAGVDGVGKSALVSALQRVLSERGLRTANVYLGCWGRYQTLAARWVSNYSPRDRPTAGERRNAAVLRCLKNFLKFGLFYGAILFEQVVRYRRGVVRTNAHLVLSDRYLYDLEIPFSRRYVRSGRRVRRWIYSWFPAPDLIFHLWADPQEIRSRKSELQEEQIVQFDEIYRRVLAGRRAHRLQVLGSPEELACRIIEERWRDLLTSCWAHAPRSAHRLVGLRKLSSQPRPVG